MLAEAKNYLPKNLEITGNILDVGCGVGRMSFEFAKIANHVIGLDVSNSMIEKAKEYAEKFKILNVSFHATDGLKYPMVNDESVDFIYCVRVMQHVPTLSIIKANLSDCARVLKPGGWLIFMTQDNFDPNGNNPTYDGVRCGQSEMKELVKDLPLKIRQFGKDGALAHFTSMQKKA
jgi:ubiquinone/menaquinone biosynthesis C-methylase UbiE